MDQDKRKGAITIQSSWPTDFDGEEFSKLLETEKFEQFDDLLEKRIMRGSILKYSEL